MSSPQYSHLVENLAISEVSKFFTNRGENPKIYYVRSKEKVELDLLIELPNQRFVAAEIKVTPQNWSTDQHKLIDSLKLNIIDRWVLTPGNDSLKLNQCRFVPFQNIWRELDILF